MKKYSILVPIILFAGFAGATGWQTYSTMRVCHDIAVAGDRVWVVTGGGVASLNRTGKSVNGIYTNVDGFYSIDVTSVVQTDAGQVCFGEDDGIITECDADGTSFRNQLFLYDGLGISSVLPWRDAYFAGGSHGLALLLNGEKKEAYTDFADQTAASVSAVICDGDSLLWIIVPKGVARSAAKPDLNNLLAPNLQDRTQWVFYGSSVLPSGTVRDIVYHNGSVWAATNAGLAEYAGGTWINHGYASSARLFSLASDGTQLLVGTEDKGVYIYNGAQWDSLSQNGLANRHIVALERDGSGTVWAATRWGGPHWFSSGDNRWYQIDLQPYGPYNDYIYSALVEDDTTVWFGGKNNDCIYRFNDADASWDLFRYPAGSWLRNIRMDGEGNKWFCTWERGLVRISVDDQVRQFYTDSTFLNEYENHHPSIFGAPDVAFKKDGTMFVANWPNDVLHYYPALDTAFEFSRDSLTGTFHQFIEMAVDQSDYLWIGTGHYGASGGAFYDGNTCLGLFDDTYELPHNYVREIMPDHLGRVWIATSYGISMYSGGSWVYNASNPILKGYTVNDIDYDSSGNIWAATDGYGVFQYSGEGEQLAHYTSYSSGLVNDVVNSVRVNRRTGDVWMGTIHGISRYASPFGAPPQTQNGMKAYPNPFKPGSGHTYITFDDIIPGSRIRIFTFVGERVISLPGRAELGKTVRWDGRNGDGSPVASGMYYYNAYDPATGECATGKFAVVR